MAMHSRASVPTIIAVALRIAAIAIVLMPHAGPAEASWSFYEDFSESGFTQSWIESQGLPNPNFQQWPFFPNELWATYFGPPTGTYENIDGAVCFKMSNTLRKYQRVGMITTSTLNGSEGEIVVRFSPLLQGCGHSSDVYLSLWLVNSEDISKQVWIGLNDQHEPYCCTDPDYCDMFDAWNDYSAFVSYSSTDGYDGASNSVHLEADAWYRMKLTAIDGTLIASVWNDDGTGPIASHQFNHALEALGNSFRIGIGQVKEEFSVNQPSLMECALDFVQAGSGWSFFEDFSLSGPTESWAASPGLPDFLADEVAATYLGSPSGTFVPVDGALAFRMTNELGQLERVGIVSAAVLDGTNGEVEARVNTLVQAPGNSTDGLFTLWLVNSSDPSKFVWVDLFAGVNGVDRDWFYDSSIDEAWYEYYEWWPESSPLDPDIFADNTWYKVRITASNGSLSASLWNDDGSGPIVVHEFSHSLEALGNAFHIGIGQRMAYGDMRAECAVDYVKATSPCLGSITGTVLAGGLPLPNATVEVRQGLVPITVATTDNTGSFVASEVPAGLTDVSVVVPLGYQAASPPGGAAVVSVVACEVATQSFTFNTVTAPGPARPLNWWRLQDNRCMGTQPGAPQVSCSALTGDYPSAVLSHFYENDVHPIQVDGVTNGGPATALTPVELQATLNAAGWSPWLDKAKSEFLALLLNVVSNRKLTTEVVDANGGTVSQAIQQIAGMINDGNPSNDHAAENLASKLNSSGSLQANTIDTGTYPDVIPFAPRPSPVVGALRVAPNPMVRSSTLQFDLASPGNTSVRVFDVAGRVVRTLLDGDLAGGHHSVAWDGTSDSGKRVASGVYFYRIDTRGGALTSRFVVMR